MFIVAKFHAITLPSLQLVVCYETRTGAAADSGDVSCVSKVPKNTAYKYNEYMHRAQSFFFFFFGELLTIMYLFCKTLNILRTQDTKAS